MVVPVNTMEALRRRREMEDIEDDEVVGDFGEVNRNRLWNPMTDGVKWVERYVQFIESFFEKVPQFISTFIATFALFVFGATLRGEWVIILVTVLKQLSGQTHVARNGISTQNLTMESFKMTHFGSFFIGAQIIAYAIYFLMGGFLHWYFYVKRRHTAKEWKIQPDKWLTPELERHEIILGCISIFFASSFSAFLACYFYNENPSTMYYQFDEYTWTWFFLQFPVVFVYMDYTTYIMHRLYHTPWLYKNFHKLHHKYKQPTAFSVTAIHPVEIVHLQLTSYLPLFVVPLHWLPFYSILFYNYYHGIIDHSGVDFKAQWWQPWQPDARFHDEHHQYFHCNFGFNMMLWDKIHGTMRQPYRYYTEDTYHGTAPLLNEVEEAADSSGGTDVNTKKTQ